MPSPVLSGSLFTSYAERRLASKLSRIPPENEDLAANVRWGGPGDIGQPIPWSYISWNKNEPEPGTDEGPGRQELTINYNEVSRETDKVRVENPEDKEIYVMVERIKSITFSTSGDGNQRKFVLKW